MIGGVDQKVGKIKLGDSFYTSPVKVFESKDGKRNGLSLISIEYTTYDLIVDKKQQTWIFDSAECQVVVFDPNLSVLQKYKGICFDACGFDTTTVLTINQTLDRVFWFKGDGVLSEFNIETLGEKVDLLLIS